jgi:uncharacterized protein
MPSVPTRLLKGSLLTLLLGAAGCGPAPRAPKPPFDLAAYETDTQLWRAKRLEAIAGADGWSTVAGLFWLDSATYSVGSGPRNAIVLPERHTAAVVGTLTIADSTVRFRTAARAGVTAGNATVDTVTLVSDKHAVPTVLRAGSVSLHLIERGGRRALRVKDTAYVLRREFKALEYFPLDTALRVTARLLPHRAPRTLRILNVIGQTEEYRTPGTLEFTIGGVTHRLTAAYEGKDTSQYFVIFRDASSRATTYPAGRFMYTAVADSNGLTVLDFNRAFNPPCAFTPFATCPLPPAENVLAMPINAGEKRYAGPHGATAVEVTPPRSFAPRRS